MPSPADVFVNCEANGNADGTALTTAILNADTFVRGVNAGTWTLAPSPITAFLVDTTHPKLYSPGPSFTVGDGNVYPRGGTNCWRYDHSVNANQTVNYAITTTSLRATASFYFRTTLNGTDGGFNACDLMEIDAGSQGVYAQFWDYPYGYASGYRFAMNCETTGTLGTLTGSQASIPIKPGVTYWVSLLYDGGNGWGRLAVYDVSNNWAYLGQSSARVTGGTAVSGFKAGINLHGTLATALTFYDDVVFEWSTGVWPNGAILSPSHLQILGLGRGGFLPEQKGQTLGDLSPMRLAFADAAASRNPFMDALSMWSAPAAASTFHPGCVKATHNAGMGAF